MAISRTYFNQSVSLPRKLEDSHIQVEDNAELSDRQVLKSHVVLDPLWGVNWKAIIDFCTPYIIVSSIKLSFTSLLQNSLAVLVKLLRSAP